MNYKPEMKDSISKAVEFALSNTPDDEMKEFSWFSIKEERAVSNKEAK